MSESLLATSQTRVETQGTSLVDLLDRLLGTGVVLSGDVIISLAGVDLVVLKLRALLTTAREDL